MKLNFVIKKLNLMITILIWFFVEKINKLINKILDLALIFHHFNQFERADIAKDALKMIPRCI